MSTYGYCPNCGEDLPSARRFCRECGASDDSGWDDAGEWEHALEEDEGWNSPEVGATSAASQYAPVARRALMGVIALLLIFALLATMW